MVIQTVMINNSQPKLPIGTPNANPGFSMYVNLKILARISSGIGVKLLFFTINFENWSIITTINAIINLLEKYKSGDTFND